MSQLTINLILDGKAVGSANFTIDPAPIIPPVTPAPPILPPVTPPPVVKPPVVTPPVTPPPVTPPSNATAVSNAGANQKVYLTKGSSATLDGSASVGDSFLWSEISSDQMSGAKIVSPTNKTTQITGLPQGVFYFNLAATTSKGTVNDYVVVSVDYDVAPVNATLAKSLNISGIAALANDSSGSDSDYNGYTAKNDYYDPTYGEMWIERSHAGGASVDKYGQKYISTIADGYKWHGNNYDRSEMYIGAFDIATGKTYIFEWKGYFPQTLIGQINNASGYADCGAIMQIHGNDGNPPPFAFSVQPNGGLTFSEWGSNGNGANNTTVLIAHSDANLLNKTHTIRVYLKEGAAGTNGFIKVLVDGVIKYSRSDNKQVGQTLNQDWPKFCTLYDWGAALVDPNNTTRKKTFSMVTEAFNIYTQ
ncbi:MAG: hypothetical protein ABI237_05890 [Ginsengibacter sp.]